MMRNIGKNKEVRDERIIIGSKVLFLIGKITIVLDTHWYEAESNSVEDLAAQERQLQFTVSRPEVYFKTLSFPFLVWMVWKRYLPSKWKLSSSNDRHNWK